MKLHELSEYTDPALREILLDGIACIDRTVFGDSRWGRDAFAENADNSYDCLLAAAEVGPDGSLTVTGYGLLRCFDDAEILMIAADPDRRRQGIGGTLLRALQNEAKRRKVSAIFLEVRESNLPARAMYKNAGFTEEGIRRGYYHEPKENAVIMRYIC